MINKKQPYNYRQLLKLLQLEEFKYLAEIIIEHKIGGQSQSDYLLDLHDKFDQFQYIIKHSKNYDDHKLSLWIPLSLEDKIKMFINQRDPYESKLMQMLIFVQYSSQPKFMKIRDELLTKTLDNAVYDKYTQLCDQEAMQIQLKNFKHLKWNDNEECWKQMNFITYLCEKYDKTSKVSRQQLMQIYNKVNRLLLDRDY